MQKLLVAVSSNFLSFQAYVS